MTAAENLFLFLKKRQAFTLLELSIVLVVIGLLIGGVLVGQSLIDGAKINSQVKQLQQIDIAISNFSVKYKSIPGDTTLFPNPGNNDKILQMGESRYFYAHLDATGFGLGADYSSPTADCYTGVTCDLSPPSLDMPLSPIGTGNGLGVWGDVFNTPMVNYWFIGGYPINTTIPSVTISAIDNKIDDGNCATGSVMIGFSSTCNLVTNPKDFLAVQFGATNGTAKVISGPKNFSLLIP